MTDEIKPTTALSTGLSSNLALYATADDDFASMSQRDIIMPNLRLQQALSPMVAIKEKAKAGDFADASNELVIVPRDTRRFIVPLCFWKEWIEWNPNKDEKDKEKKIIDRSNDPSSALALSAERFEMIQYGDKELVRVTEYYNFIVAMRTEEGGAIDYGSLFVINFSKTSHKTGKVWLNKLSNAKVVIDGERKKAPIWYNEWELYSQKETDDNGRPYFTSQIGSSRNIDPKFHEFLAKNRDLFQKKREEIMSRNSAVSEASEDTTKNAVGPNAQADAKKGEEPPF
jgi:hypothetical protein